MASTQTTNTKISAFIAVLVFKQLSPKVLFINKKRQQKLLKSRLHFKEIESFTSKFRHGFRVSQVSQDD